MSAKEEKLYLRFHGRIIDSLGIQMYQSPVAAIAELIANAWDADASKVGVELPENLSGESTIIVRDNGLGMTFKQCQELYLNVGYNRRIGEKASKTPEGRPVLGRKGIGKLAGFGISKLLEVDTTSRETGERTVFQLNLDDLRSGDYINTEAKEIPIITREQRSANGTKNSETIITLKGLTLNRAPSKRRFAKSMARRFLVNQVAGNFEIKINGSPLPKDNALSGVEKEGEKPEGLKIRHDMGYEKIDDDEIEWQIKFMKDPISTEELRGVSVFCGIKVAQTPFFFNLSGGLQGQLGQQYVSGQVRADYLDRLTTDVITTERQRINWEIQGCKGLEKWGQERVKSLLAIWQERRAAPRLKWIEDRTASFSPILKRLKSAERRTLSSVPRKVVMIETLSEQQCRGVLEGILKAWDRGHLRCGGQRQMARKVYAGLSGRMRDGVQQQQGFEGLVVVAEREYVGPFLPNSLAASFGRFWGR